MDDQAAGAVGRADDGAVASAFEHVVVGGQRQAALALVLAMALEAVRGEDGLDLPLESTAVAVELGCAAARATNVGVAARATSAAIQTRPREAPTTRTADLFTAGFASGGEYIQSSPTLGARPYFTRSVVRVRRA